MRLQSAIADPKNRAHVAAAAVAEAELAIRERSGLRGAAAQVGLDTINLLRPGFLERHVYELLPAMADVLDPHWEAGLESGSPHRYLEGVSEPVTQDLLAVTDQYVDAASDAKAIAVYRRLRPYAPSRIAEQMPRIATFIERHEDPDYDRSP